MAYYRPDHDLIKGNELISKLRGEKGRLIKYVISKQDDRIKKLNETIDEMYKVFEGIKKFTR